MGVVGTTSLPIVLVLLLLLLVKHSPLITPRK